MLGQLSGVHHWSACAHVLRVAVSLLTIPDSLAALRTAQLMKGLFAHAKALSGSSYAFAFGLLAVLLELAAFSPPVRAWCAAPERHEAWLWAEEFLLNARAFADSEELNYQQRVIVAGATGGESAAAQVLRNPSGIVPQPLTWSTGAGAANDDMRQALLTPKATARMVLQMLRQLMLSCGLEPKPDPPTTSPAAATAPAATGSAPEA